MDSSPLSIVEQGTKADWMAWLAENPRAAADLSQAKLKEKDLQGWPLAGVNLRGADLTEADLRHADLSGADLTGADLSRARLRGAKLVRARLDKAFLNGAFLQETDFTSARLRMAELPNARFYKTKFCQARLQGANLAGTKLQGVDFTLARLGGANLADADLHEAKLCHAVLNRAYMERARLFGVDLKGAKIREASVYGISAWGLLNADSAIQRDLLITPRREAEIRVDDLELAQFVYLILSNEKFRNVMTAKVVLILGRFQPQQMAILKSIKTALRNDEFVPLLFDFEPSPQRNLSETIQVLAGLAAFVIADLTTPRSVIGELQKIVPAFPSLPVQPILHASETAYALLKDLQESYPWLRPEFSYHDSDDLLRNLKDRVIQPAEAWRLQKRQEAEDKARVEELERQVANERAKREESERQAASAQAELERVRREYAELQRSTSSGFPAKETT